VRFPESCTSPSLAQKPCLKHHACDCSRIHIRCGSPKDHLLLGLPFFPRAVLPYLSSKQVLGKYFVMVNIAVSNLDCADQDMTVRKKLGP
jgi:hypothetical protein